MDNNDNNNINDAVEQQIEVPVDDTISSKVIIDDSNAKTVAKTEIAVGDTVIVNYKIVEGEKSRIQPFEGIVIAIKGSNISKTFTVRRIGANSIGIERIFPLFSPNIDSIKVKSHARVRRAKLYYMRDRIGKAARKVNVD